jgi:4-amino-4-deoxy-L-arabinose transferase-like glycosyltransferase
LASDIPKDRCIPCEDGRKLLLAALAVRVLWAVVSHRFWGYHDDGLYDDGVYLEMARAWLGQGALNAAHPPGYSLFLAPFLALGGDLGVSLARWVQLLVSALTSVLTYRLALNLRLSRAAALCAGAAVALDPMLIYFSARIMSESLFVALVAGFLLAWLYAWQSGRARDAALAGVLGGAAALTRGVILPFGGVLALVALWRRREQPRWAALVAVCGLCWAGVMAPWTARNWFAYRRFVPVSVQGGWNFYEGLTVDPDQVRHARAEAMGAEAARLGLTDAFSKDAYFAAKAKEWIRENPGAFLRLCAVKAARFWRLAPEPPHGLASRLAAGAFSLALFAFALLGVRAALRAPGAWFLFAWIAFLNLLHAVFASNMRYRLPLAPVLAALAGAGLAALFNLER